MEKEKTHKLETRDFTVKRTFCVQAGCKFKEKIAAQGICFGELDKVTKLYLDHAIQHGEEFLRQAKANRKIHGARKQKDWIKYLEGHVVCQWANSEFTLDELIHLRAENARLRIRLGKWSGGKRKK